MDVAAYSTAVKLEEVGAKAGVQVLKGANEQAKAVANILLAGIQSAPVLPDGKGERLNISA